MSSTINWTMIQQAFALVGYKFSPPEGESEEMLLSMWLVFLEDYRQCELNCAWKGGGPCTIAQCPRRVCRRVSLTHIPPTTDAPPAL